MTTTSIMPTPRQRYFTNSGTPAAGCYLYTFAAGTSTPKAAYTDAAGTTPHANPIVLDAKGEALIYWSGAYKVDLKTAAGVQITGYPVDNYQSYDSVTNSVATNLLRADLAASSGAGLVGFSQSFTYPRSTTGRKLLERVSVADMLTTDTPTAAQVLTALQAAIDTGAKKVFISAEYTINGAVNLAANQIIDFDGGSLIIASGTVAPNGILYGSAKANIKIVDPVIDASATAGIGGINLIDCPSGRIIDGLLTKCNINFQAASNAVRMGYKARGTVVNMSGWLATACYISAANKVSLCDLELFGGKEGVGIYNDARAVKHSQIDSYSHTQDGFVVIAGQRIDYTGCMGYDNGQSGFTTQRQTLATNTRRISYSGCHAYDNAYDGFDLRGANAVSFANNMLITATACIATGNTGAGFYVVYAEGTNLIGCVGSNNLGQNFMMNGSARTQLTGCRSASGASTVAAGNTKAGILFQDSPGSIASGCESSNSEGATQSYGISFTGTSLNCAVDGGYYENNSVAPMYLGPSGAAAYVTGAAMQTVGNIWTQGVDGNTGAYNESGFGVPAHTRPKGSIFKRTDGAGGELYQSNGGGAWRAI